MAVTLKDIAKKTGYSVNTVSLAMKNSPRISEEATRLIQESANELHYIPNYAARSLVTKRSNLVGLLVRDFSSVTLNLVAAYLERKLSSFGYSLVLVTSEQTKSEVDALKFLEAQQVDGIFIFPFLPPDRHFVDYVRNINIPTIMLAFGDYEMITDAIYVDKEYASYLATKHLLSLGHIKIALISGSASHTSNKIDCERLSGYCKALEEAGVRYNPAYTIIPTAKSQYEAGYAAAETILNYTDVTALVAANDSLGVGATKYFQQQGIRVPEDISIVTNDSTEIAKFAPVPLTATVYNADLLTDKAVEAMIDKMEHGKNSSAFVRIPIKATIDIRQSTCEVKGNN